MTSPNSGSLDTTSLLNEGGWSGSLFPGAGELSGAMVLRSTMRSQPMSTDRCCERDGAMRAARTARRFVVANELRSMVTLTFRCAVDAMKAASDMKLLMRRCCYGRDPFPFLWTLERGSHRGRIHGHLLVPASLGPLAEDAWDNGHVDVVVKPQGWQALREQAAYIAKAFDSPVLSGQRYRVPKGFQPETIKIDAFSPELLITEAEARMGTRVVKGHRSGIVVSAQWES
jgi:hypothetical protein